METRPAARRIAKDIEAILICYQHAVVFADLNLNQNMLWVKVRPIPGICVDIPAAIRMRVPEAKLVALKLRQLKSNVVNIHGRDNCFKEIHVPGFLAARFWGIHDLAAIMRPLYSARPLGGIITVRHSTMRYVTVGIAKTKALFNFGGKAPCRLRCAGKRPRELPRVCLSRR